MLASTRRSWSSGASAVMERSELPPTHTNSAFTHWGRSPRSARPLLPAVTNSTYTGGALVPRNSRCRFARPIWEIGKSPERSTFLGHCLLTLPALKSMNIECTPRVCSPRLSELMGCPWRGILPADLKTCAVPLRIKSFRVRNEFPGRRSGATRRREMRSKDLVLHANLPPRSQACGCAARPPPLCRVLPTLPE